MTILFATLAATFVLVVIFALVDLAVKDIKECKHTHFAAYHSRKKSICIDCGFEKPLEKHL